MKKLAVRFHKDLEKKPPHIPGHWPAETFEIPDDMTPPTGWQVMYDKELEAYQKRHFVETKYVHQEDSEPIGETLSHSSWILPVLGIIAAALIAWGLTRG